MFELLKGQVIAAQENIMGMMNNGTDKGTLNTYVGGTVNTLDRIVDGAADQKLISQAEYAVLDDMLDELAFINE